MATIPENNEIDSKMHVILPTVYCLSLLIIGIIVIFLLVLNELEGLRVTNPAVFTATAHAATFAKIATDLRPRLLERSKSVVALGLHYSSSNKMSRNPLCRDREARQKRKVDRQRHDDQDQQTDKFCFYS